MRLCAQFGILGKLEYAVLNTKRNARIPAICLLNCLFITAKIFLQFGNNFANFNTFFLACNCYGFTPSCVPCTCKHGYITLVF